MPLHPEELRLARSLRELILEAGTTVEDVEGRLGWDAERLSTLLAGQKGWRFEEVLDVVSTLEVEPADFFARVYGLQGERSVESVLDEIVPSRGEHALENFYDDLLDRRFEESEKAVQEAVRRRALWKRERAES